MFGVSCLLIFQKVAQNVKVLRHLAFGKMVSWRP
jgi:hypothetical protein